MAKHRKTQITPHDSQGTLVFGSQKIFPKFDRGHPNGGAKWRWGRVDGEFRQITRRISKTVQDRRIVSIKVEQEVVCALSNGDISDDLG